jgi:hypothetical protein
MLLRLVETLLGCWHGNYSFPMTLRSGQAGKRWNRARPPRTYVVWLECGRELPYDWGQMKVMSRKWSTHTPIENEERSQHPAGALAPFPSTCATQHLRQYFNTHTVNN